MAKRKRGRLPNVEQVGRMGKWRYVKWIHRGRPDEIVLRSPAIFDSAEEAYEALQEALKLLHKHGAQALDQAKVIPTFGELSERWITQVVPVTCKVSTLADYRAILDTHLLPVLGEMPVNTITRGDIKALLMGKVAAGYAISTVIHLKNAISGVLALAVDDEVLPANPALALGKLWRDKPTGTEVQPFTIDELRQLLGTFKASWPRYYPLVATLALAGLRAGEALGLHWDDLDFDRGLIHVKRSLSRMTWETPKSGKPRVTTMATGLAALLQEHRTAQKREALAKGWGKIPELVFVNRDGGPVDINHFRGRVWFATLAKAEVPRRRIHDLRHASVTLRLADGQDLLSVSKEHGHHSPSFTDQHYNHWTPDAREREHADRLAQSLGVG